MTVRQIAAVKTARYAVLGAEDGPVDEVWMACHGYGQLVPFFGRHFRAVDRPGRLVVVPEALSRFYVTPIDAAPARDRRVGATWMTREERETDIGDIVRYLDDVFVAACARADADPLTVRLTGVGFSQGTATIGRWLSLSPLLARRATRADRLLVWGGRLPDDLGAEAEWLAETGVTLVAGDRDAYATPERVREEAERLRTAGVPVEVRTFPGDHRLDADMLRALGAE